MGELIYFPETAGERDWEALDREGLLRALEQVRTQLRQMDEEEPEDMESEAYQIWGEAHEELEDQADELLERLDAWEE